MMMDEKEDEIRRKDADERRTKELREEDRKDLMTIKCYQLGGERSKGEGR